MDGRLCVVPTDTFLEILTEAKTVMTAADYNFAAEIELAERNNRDPSLVIRRSLRDFSRNIDHINIGQWRRLLKLYQAHRKENNAQQMKLRIEVDGQNNLDAIRAYIEGNKRIGDIVTVTKPGGVRLPSVMILIFALAWEIETKREIA